MFVTVVGSKEMREPSGDLPDSCAALPPAAEAAVALTTALNFMVPVATTLFLSLLSATLATQKVSLS